MFSPHDRTFTVRLFFGLLVSFFALFALPASAEEVPIVYTRCVRTTTNLDLTGEIVRNGTHQTETRRMTGLDVYDSLPDVVNYFDGFSAPCDLVLRDSSGEEQILYDCSSTSTSEHACAAMDPAVSFDGNTIAFTVFRGRLISRGEPIAPGVIDWLAENTDPVLGVTYPNRYLEPAEAQLHLIEIATQIVTPFPHQDQSLDFGPTFLLNGRIAFISTRDRNNATIVFGTNKTELGARIWTIDIDGRNLELTSHHALGRDGHPFSLRDGRIVYSSWQIFGGLPFRSRPDTPGASIYNLFHLYTQTPDGTNSFSFYGQHSGSRSITTSIGIEHRAAHFLTQTSDGRVWFADYASRNNSGLGAVIGVMPEPAGREGMAPDPRGSIGDFYAPHDAINLARWSHNGDGMSAPMPAPTLTHPNYANALPFAGRLGHPAALPNHRLMVTWGKGACSTVSSPAVFPALGRTSPPLTNGPGEGRAMNVITSLEMDTPGCDTGIYEVTSIPSMHPSDLRMIVDHREWHEFQARAVLPYSSIHNIEHPLPIDRAETRISRPELELGTPFGLLGAASILDRETHPIGGLHFMEEHQFHLQGTDTIEYSDDDLCGIRILVGMPNRGEDTLTQISNIAGERVAILGEIPVRHHDGSGAIRMDPSGHPDTSFLVRIPGDTPFLLQAIDCSGHTLNTEQSWQSLRPGEMKTCGGCHTHSRSSRIDFSRSFAASGAYPIPALGEGEVPLLAGQTHGSVDIRSVSGQGLQIDLNRDIFPIFERRCVSCHGGASPIAGLALDRPGTNPPSTSNEASTWWCLIADKTQRCVPEDRRFQSGIGDGGTMLHRPQLTRYVRAFNALGSLLYWKAAGRRMDGRTDTTFDDSSGPLDRDIDFGPAHPTDISPEELGLLSRWIDIGTPGGPMELRDTQKPTLHLSALTTVDEIHELRVGTVDIGSGVDPESLEVCFVTHNECETNLASAAAIHGVIRIPFAAPISDPSVEILARVRDFAGNQTEVRRTVAFLLASSPPRPPSDCSCRATRDGSSTVRWLFSIGLVSIALGRRRRAMRISTQPRSNSLR